MPGIDSFTKLLLHCDGTDASTSFVDSSSFVHSPSAIGNAQIDTAQSKFGGASALLDGTGDYISTPDSSDWDLGLNDFTIDAWVRFADLGNNTICARTTGPSSYFYFTFEGTGLRLRDFTGSNNVDFTRSVSISTGTWYHVAVIRTSNTYRMFLDGVQQGADYTNSNAWTNRSDPLDVGHMTQNAGYAFNGWIDEFRFSNGVARWTTDFTPPTAAYSADNELIVTETEEIEVSDEIEMQLDTDLGGDEVEISDEGIFKLAKSQEDSEEIEVSDEINVDVGVNSQEEVIISDEIDVNIPVEYLDLSEEVVIGDSSDVNLIIPSEFASSIISVNPLIFVTDDDPVQVVKVDTTDPVNPTWTVKIIDETGVDTKNAKDIAYDSVEDVLYVATAEGKLLKINFSNLDVLEEIDLVDTDDLIDVEIHEDFRRVLAATDQKIGRAHV